MVAIYSGAGVNINIAIHTYISIYKNKFMIYIYVTSYIVIMHYIMLHVYVVSLEYMHLTY